MISYIILMDSYEDKEAECKEATSKGQSSTNRGHNEDQLPAVPKRNDQDSPKTSTEETPGTTNDDNYWYAKDYKDYKRLMASRDKGKKGYQSEPENSRYPFDMGTAALSTPYTIHSLKQVGVQPDDVRKALGFSPGFMAKLFRVALAADPAIKNSNAKFGKDSELYKLSMKSMVAESVVPRLCQGWLPWAEDQAAEWEAMPDGVVEAAKEAMQIEEHHRTK